MRSPGSSIWDLIGRPRRRTSSRPLPLILLVVSSPAPLRAEVFDAGQVRSSLVYGNDDLEEAPASAWAARARASSVALVPAQSVQRDGDRARLFGTALTETFSLCSGEPFADEPSVAKCSGVLVANDLVLTAGHCFHDGEACSKYVYVFDYTLDAASVVPATSVYTCSEIVARKPPPDDGDGDDYALVRLTRAADGRTPAALSISAWSPGESLTVIGYPLGLPAKVDTGAAVTAVGDDTRLARVTSDSFMGSSGSPAFGSDDELRGIVVAGGVDFVEDPSGCLRTRTVDAAAGEGELAVPLERVVNGVCKSASADAGACAALTGGAEPHGGCSVASALSARHEQLDALGPFLLLMIWSVERRRRRLRSSFTDEPSLVERLAGLFGGALKSTPSI